MFNIHKIVAYIKDKLGQNLKHLNVNEIKVIDFNGKMVIH
jgi:hypothetical protein